MKLELEGRDYRETQGSKTNVSKLAGALSARRMCRI